MSVDRSALMGVFGTPPVTFVRGSGTDVLSFTNANLREHRCDQPG